MELVYEQVEKAAAKIRRFSLGELGIFKICLVVFGLLAGAFHSRKVKRNALPLILTFLMSAAYLVVRVCFDDEDDYDDDDEYDLDDEDDDDYDNDMDTDYTAEDAVIESAIIEEENTVGCSCESQAKEEPADDADTKDFGEDEEDSENEDPENIEDKENKPEVR